MAEEEIALGEGLLPSPEVPSRFLKVQSPIIMAALLLMTLGACQPSILPSSTENTIALNGSAAQSAHLTIGPSSGARESMDYLSVKDLIGLPGEKIAGVFGKPRRVRKESLVEVWQYADEDCILDLYLYPSQGDLSVTFVEARDAAAIMAETESCANSLAHSQAISKMIPGTF